MLTIGIRYLTKPYIYTLITARKIVNTLLRSFLSSFYLNINWYEFGLPIDMLILVYFIPIIDFQKLDL